MCVRGGWAECWGGATWMDGRTGRHRAFSASAERGGTATSCCSGAFPNGVELSCVLVQGGPSRCSKDDGALEVLEHTRLGWAVARPQPRPSLSTTWLAPAHQPPAAPTRQPTHPPRRPFRPASTPPPPPCLPCSWLRPAQPAFSRMPAAADSFSAALCITSRYPRLRPVQAAAEVKQTRRRRSRRGARDRRARREKGRGAARRGMEAGAAARSLQRGMCVGHIAPCATRGVAYRAERHGPRGLRPARWQGGQTPPGMIA